MMSLYNKNKHLKIHLKLQQLCFVEQVSERTKLHFVFSDTLVSYICIGLQARGSPCWPTHPLFKTSTFKRLSLRPRKMDIDLQPQVKGLNYRVVDAVVAGQQREQDRREEEKRR